MEKNRDILEGSVVKSLIKFTLPILLALLLQVMYGSVDLLVVGNFGSVADVSGVSTGSQLMTTITSLCTGLAMGTTILIGQKRGEKKDDEINSVIFNSILLFLVLSFTILIILVIFKNNILNIMNTPVDAYNQTSQYVLFCAFGIPVIFSYNVLGSIFRGLGDSKTPLIAVGIACFVNILGDLLLVAVFSMGSLGAAIATVIAQLVSVIISLVIIKKKKTLGDNFSVSKKNINFEFIKKVILLGFPIALQSVLVSISFLFVTIIVNQYGVIFSASVGVTEKLTGMVMLIPLAFMQSIAVYVAQNFGANNLIRAKQGLKYGLLISFSAGVVMAYFSFFHGEHLIKLYSQDTEVIKNSSMYLKAYALDTLQVPFMFCLTAYFNGLGKTFFVMIQGVTGAILLRLPLTFLFSNIEPVSLFTIGLATPIATFIQIIMCVMYFIYIDKKINKDSKMCVK